MALNTEEINKINGLYAELDVLKSENKVLREQLTAQKGDLNERFDKLEELIKAGAGSCKCD